MILLKSCSMRTISLLKILPLFFLLLFLASCGCGGGKSRYLRVGIDPTWYPNDFGSQQPYINGFIEDLLLEIAGYTGIEFEKITANSGSLFEGIERDQYDVILSSFPPYAYNQAKYDFSQSFLDLGPVLVVSQEAKYTELSELENRAVGIVSGNPAVFILEKEPSILIRRYNSVPSLLNALANGEIEAAVNDSIPTLDYVQDLYRGRLKIAGEPLTKNGLRMITSKDRFPYVLKKFDASLDHLRKKKRLSSLLQKWQLS